MKQYYVQKEMGEKRKRKSSAQISAKNVLIILNYFKLILPLFELEVSFPHPILQSLCKANNQEST